MEEEQADSSERDWTRIGLLVCAVIVTVAAGFLIPAFATDGLAGSPIEQALPGEAASDGADEAGGVSGEGGLGALNPGEATGVGGEVALDSDTYGSTDTELHFTVESSEASYWRTASFDTYTGSGWERNGGAESLDGSIEHDGMSDERIEYEIEFEQTATAVPTAWRPTVVEGVDDPQVTDDKAISTDQPIEAGSTVEGVSYSPERDEGLLQAASGEYPSEIEEQYTQLPSDTPDRIEEFTAGLTADEEGPYETAVAIEQWLKTEKDYDLDVSERGENIAETFIFDMDAGYCEYFATAMVTMLRSQDIPSRYVVGYTPGQNVGDDTYEVRAMNAHAWVEVYFEDVGWVKFDPTPGDDRLSTEEEALEDADSDFEPGDVDLDDLFDPDENDEEPPTSDDRGLQTSLNQTAVPGEPVEVTVTENDAPLYDVTVEFNGESIGTTASDGTVVGTVPDAEQLQITVPEDSFDQTWDGGDESPVSEEDEEREDSSGETSSGASMSTVGAGVSATGSGVVASPKQVGSSTASSDELESDETYPIERNATVSVAGEPRPGGTVTVTARVGDVLLEGATVTVGDESVGQTDESGQQVVELPETTGNVTIAVERDSVTGETVTTIPELSIDVDTGTVPAMALGSATVEATVDDEPATGVPVEINGEEVATTGADGTAALDLPLRSDATIAVTYYGQSQQVVLSGLLLRFGLASGLLLSIFSISLYALSKRGYGPTRLFAALRATPGWIAFACQRTLVTLATRGDELAARAVDRLRATLIAVADLLSGKRNFGEVRAGIVAWLVNVRKRARKTLAEFRMRRAETERATDRPTVQQAWRRFLAHVSVSSPTTRTPGELAAHAVEQDNLPKQPVITLRDTFREAEYGSRSASDRLEHVQDAIDQIEQAARERDETVGGN